MKQDAWTQKNTEILRKINMIPLHMQENMAYKIMAAALQDHMQKLFISEEIYKTFPRSFDEPIVFDILNTTLGLADNGKWNQLLQIPEIEKKLTVRGLVEELGLYKFLQ